MSSPIGARLALFAALLSGCAAGGSIQRATPLEAKPMVWLDYGPCMFGCPAFELVLFDDGTVVYTGTKFGVQARIAPGIARIGPQRVIGVRHALADGEFAKLGRRYGLRYTDQTVVKVGVRAGEQLRVVIVDITDSPIVPAAFVEALEFVRAVGVELGWLFRPGSEQDRPFDTRGTVVIVERHGRERTIIFYDGTVAYSYGADMRLGRVSAGLARELVISYERLGVDPRACAASDGPWIRVLHRHRQADHWLSRCPAHDTPALRAWLARVDEVGFEFQLVPTQE